MAKVNVIAYLLPLIAIPVFTMGGCSSDGEPATETDSSCADIEIDTDTTELDTDTTELDTDTLEDDTDTTETDTDTSDDEFVKDIKPILDENCAICHMEGDYHDFDDEPEIKGACYTCHDGDGPGEQDTIYSYPPMTNYQQVMTAINRGTFRSWLQAGGFMNWKGDPNDFDGNPYPIEFSLINPKINGLQSAILEHFAYKTGANRVLSYNPELVAKEIAEDFEVDGTGNASQWSTASELIVNVEPTIYTAAKVIKLKALYSAENLYLRVEYEDDTLSMTRGGWKFDSDPKTWTPATKDPLLANDYPSEDRVAVMWNMNISDFKATYGCAVKCHGNQPGYACFLDEPGTKADMWHSKANRGLGVLGYVINDALTVNKLNHEVTAGSATLRGFCDDKYVEWYQGPNFDTEDSGRRPDEGTSSYSHNRNEAKTAPKYAEKEPLDFLDAMLLTQAEIDADEAISIDPDDENVADDDAIKTAWEKYKALRAVVPERILSEPTLSRGNVRHSATWSGSTWVNEFKRALDTQSPLDDVIFDDKSERYEFGIAVFDNCGRGEMPPGHTTYGDGQYLYLTFAE